MAAAIFSVPTIFSTSASPVGGGRLRAGLLTVERALVSELRGRFEFVRLARLDVDLSESFLAAIRIRDVKGG
jgi:hypothetical protein